MIVAAGALVMFRTLLAYAGGIDGVDGGAAGWHGDPAAWQRTALVLSAAGAVVGVAGFASAILTGSRRARPLALGAALAAGAWLWLMYG